MSKGTPFLAYLEIPASKEKCITQAHALLPPQFFFLGALFKDQRNTADDSKGHCATNNAERKDCLKAVLFTRWSHAPELTLFRVWVCVCVSNDKNLNLIIHVGT